MTSKNLSNRYSYLVLAVVVIGMGVLGDYAFHIKSDLAGDAFGYIEEARNLLRGNGLVRVPYGLAHLRADLMPQPFFPPGFPILIALFSSLGVSELDSAVWLTRIAWMLIGVMTFLLLREVSGMVMASWVALLVSFSPSFYLTGSSVFSDGICLFLILVSLRYFIAAIESSPRLRLLCISGLFGGLAYGVRNAALAYLIAIGSTLLILFFVRRMAGRAVLEMSARFGFGVVLPIIPLALRNLYVFGKVQPYHDAAVGTYADIVTASRSTLESLVLDITASKEVARYVAWDYRVLVVTAGLFCLGLLIAMARSLKRADRRQLFLIVFTGVYFSAALGMVIAAQVLYGVDSWIRHVMPCTLTFFVLTGTMVAAAWKPKASRVLAISAAVATVLLFARIRFIADDLHRELTMASAFDGRRPIAESAREFASKRWNMRNQINRLVAGDPEVRRILAAIPDDALIFSNYGGFLSFLSNRPVRTLEWRGAFELYEQLGVAVREISNSRPVYVAIVPDNRMLSRSRVADWKSEWITAMPPSYRLYRATDDLLVLAVP